MQTDANEYAVEREIEKSAMIPAKIRIVDYKNGPTVMQIQVYLGNTFDQDPSNEQGYITIPRGRTMAELSDSGDELRPLEIQMGSIPEIVTRYLRMQLKEK